MSLNLCVCVCVVCVYFKSFKVLAHCPNKHQHRASVPSRGGLAIGRFGRFPERPDDFRLSQQAVILALLHWQCGRDKRLSFKFPLHAIG